MISLLNFHEQGVVQVLIEEWYFIEGGAESIFYFCVGALEVEDVLVLFWEFFREVNKGLLISLLAGVGIFFEKVGFSFGIDYQSSIRELSEKWILASGLLIGISLTHDFKFY